MSIDALRRLVDNHGEKLIEGDDRTAPSDVIRETCAQLPPLITQEEQELAQTGGVGDY